MMMNIITCFPVVPELLVVLDVANEIEHEPRPRAESPLRRCACDSLLNTLDELPETHGVRPSQVGA